MQRSTVVDDETGESVVDDYRTSYGTFLYRFQTPIIETIQRRITLITHLPVENQEDIQILRYANGQYYHEHTDSLDNENPRVATLLIYLSDPTEGGETSFPQTKHWINLATGEKYGLGLSDCAQGGETSFLLTKHWSNPTTGGKYGPGLSDCAQTKHWINPTTGGKYGPGLSDCAQSHVAFKPHRGDALLFWDYNPDGKTEDPMSSHEGCPVTKGVKWTTTTWIHSLPFNGQEWNGTHFTRALSADAFKDPGWCRDVHRRCPGWAKNGECEKNAKFMKGSNSDGKCPASCGVCIPCDPEDMECYNNNRRAMNYVAFNPGEMTWRDFKDAVQEKR
eukprot:gene11647-34356_t